PKLSLDELLQQARTVNPSLNALRTREHVADVTVKASKGAYLPTVSLRAGVNGYGNTFTSTNALVASAPARKVGGSQSTAGLKQVVVQPADPSVGLALQLTTDDAAA